MSSATNKVGLGQLLGQSYNGGNVINSYLIDRYPAGYNQFALRRLGKKDYAFFALDNLAYVARYKCSHLEARRRFAMLLITRRLSK